MENGEIKTKRYYNPNSKKEFMRLDEFIRKDVTIQIGDICIFDNDKKIIASNFMQKKELQFILDGTFFDRLFIPKDVLEEIANNKIVKIERPNTYQTIYENIKENILDEQEKEYLSNVIKPFKKNITCIVKQIAQTDNQSEYIHIVLKDDAAFLPNFKKGKMYKGMVSNQQYTLKELGL